RIIVRKPRDAAIDGLIDGCLGSAYGPGGCGRERIDANQSNPGGSIDVLEDASTLTHPFLAIEESDDTCLAIVAGRLLRANRIHMAGVHCTHILKRQRNWQRTINRRQ